MITWENYEEYMMLHADGELKPAEEQELMSFVYEHPELANELAAFSMSKMIPDTTMVYANKKALLKKEPATVMAFPHWQRYAVAAGVAALLFVAGVRTFYGGDDSAAVVAVNDRSFTAQPAQGAMRSVQDDKVGVEPVQSTTGSVQDDKEEGVAAHPDSYRDNSSVQDDKKVGQNIAAIVSPQHTAPVPTEKTTRVKPTTIKQRTIATKPETAVAVVKELIEYVPAEYIGLANMNNPEKFSPVAVTNVPPATIQITEEGDTKSFVDKLPIDELKKNGIKNVATAMASGYDKVNAIRQGINEASITVKVEKRKLILSF